MIPDLEQSGNSGDLPHGSLDLGGGYVLLCMLEAEECTLWDYKAEALQESVYAAPRDSNILVCWWAKLQIPTGQNCTSAWKELEKLLKRQWTAHNVKVCLALHSP